MFNLLILFNLVYLDGCLKHFLTVFVHVLDLQDLQFLMQILTYRFLHDVRIHMLHMIAFKLQFCIFSVVHFPLFCYALKTLVCVAVQQPRSDALFVWCINLF